ncbi:methyltransferase domain-containing protein [Streptomyces solincola]|uniref:methyltransferase domain-containing protein n=1 Tax=Streptomyces solincola TaxID=2100817 RepID=UPI002158D402|nr:methyltransferase domain-containing protein [Streptomyces solincola]
MSATPQSGHAALVDLLHGRGLLDETWRAVWHAVPREPFIPARAWRQEPDGCVPLTGEADRLALVHADEPVIVQVDDGKPDGPSVATSSNSQPSMVARMLGLLDVADGHRVLEIGTATGYVAALLSRRLGERNVHSVEIDPAMAAWAREALRAAGYAPHLAHGDGEQGWPGAAAPFDRLLVTCAVRHVPYPLVRQLRPGGVLVTPLARDFWSGAVVRLAVGEDGTARGRFHGGASYMPMRAHRKAEGAPVEEATARPTAVCVDPAQLLDLGFALYAGARLPGVSMLHAEEPDGGVRVWLRAPDGSAATAASREDAWLYGPRDLWGEVETVYGEYVRLGSPAADAFGLVVGAEEEWIWVGDPSRRVGPA